jgi:hypothetical protein
MCLVRMLYHDNSVWVDRTKNLDRPPNLSSYDLTVAYTQPDIELVPVRWFRHPVKWEIRSRRTGPGQFLASSPNANGAASLVTFSPRSARKGQRVTVTVPGLADVVITVLYRIVSGGKTDQRVVTDWCKLDSRGTCTVVAPSPAGTMRVDWLQPANQRWILTSGGLSVTD